MGDLYQANSRPHHRLGEAEEVSNLVLDISSLSNLLYHSINSRFLVTPYRRLNNKSQPDPSNLFVLNTRKLTLWCSRPGLRGKWR